MLVDERAVVYRQINTDRDGRYRITKTYATDPARPTVLTDLEFESLAGRAYQVYALYDPGLDNGGDDDSGSLRARALVATDGGVASALAASPELGERSTG